MDSHVWKPPQWRWVDRYIFIPPHWTWTDLLRSIASFYKVSHLTLQRFDDRLNSNCSIGDLLKLLTDAEEYSKLPVRHNEDNQYAELAKLCPLEIDQDTCDSAHTKAHLLFQAHFSRLPLPVADYAADTESVLCPAVCILKAMLDLTFHRGWLATALRVQQLLQMVIQGRWVHDPPVLTLPHLDKLHLPALKSICGTNHIPSLPELLWEVDGRRDKLSKELVADLGHDKVREILRALSSMPIVRLTISVKGFVPNTITVCDRPMKINPSSILESDWVQVACWQEYILNVQLAVTCCRNRKRGDRFAHAPRFLRIAHAPRLPKLKEEGWDLFLGSMESNELVAHKRLGPLQGWKSEKILFSVPLKPGRFILTLYVMSDSYLGLDQQYSLQFEAVEESNQFEESRLRILKSREK